MSETINQSPDYLRGLSVGFREGYNTALEQIYFLSQQQSIKLEISPEEFQKLQKRINEIPMPIGVLEALEKQIPKKPKVEKWEPARCPSCEESLSESMGDGYYKHWYGKKICDCGQRLDWGE